MKREIFIKNLQNLILGGLAIILIAVSCDPPVDPPVSQGKKGIYILNEGGFNMNNGSLTFYNFDNHSVISDIFLQSNNRGLGDVANDMKQYGSKIYIVVNNSEIVEVINLENAKSLKQISLTGKQPRNIAFFENKAYVSCFDGTVVRIDTTTLQIDGSALVGTNPEGICVVNDKLYVANSGGLSSPITSNTISVVDLNSFTETKRIQVAVGPRILKADQYGDLYAACTGNYGNIPASFHRINTLTDEVVQNFDLPVQNFTIQGNLAYVYSYNYIDHSKWIKVLDISTENIVNENFISDATNITIPYGISVDPITNLIYITDAGDYVSTGDVYCFNATGYLQYQFEAGIIPNGAMIFKWN
jgi:hypothetical protein